MIFEKAKWIRAACAACPNEYTDFLDIFTLAAYREVTLFVSSETNYEVYLNGAFIASGQYHDYRECKVYDEVDLSPHVLPGENRLAVIGYFQHTDCSFYLEKGLGLLYEVVSGGEAVCWSGGNTLSRRSLAYQSGEMDRITGQIGYTYYYNCNRYDGWRDTKEAVDGFAPSVSLPDTVPLIPRPIRRCVLKKSRAYIVTQGIYRLGNPCSTLAQTLQRAWLSHRLPEEIAGQASPVLPSEKGITLTGDEGCYLVIDLKRECSGYFTLDIETDRPGDLLVCYGEHLEDMRPRSYIGGRCFAFSIGVAAGRNRYANYMKRLGLRYLMLFLPPGKTRLYNANIIRSEYPVGKVPRRFACPLWNKIYSVGVNTLHLCMHEHYEDTPWREQSLYAMDSRTQMLCGYYCFCEYAFPRASLLLLSRSLREDGLLSLCSPMSKNCERLTIMSFSLIYFVQVAEYLRYSGDMSLLEEIREVLATLMKTFHERVETNGLLSNFCRREHWNFYEWTDGSDGNFDCVPEKRYECPLNAFYSLALSAYAYCLDLTGAKARSRELREEAAHINCAIDQFFYDGEHNCYASFLSAEGELSHYAELTQSLVLLCGAGAPQHRSEAQNRLMRGNNGLISVSVSHSVFKYEALLNTGSAAAQNFVISELERVWGGMLERGATSFWETENGANAFGGAGSLSHGWSAVPVYILSRIAEENKEYGI